MADSFQLILQQLPSWWIDVVLFVLFFFILLPISLFFFFFIKKNGLVIADSRLLLLLLCFQFHFKKIPKSRDLERRRRNAPEERVHKFVRLIIPSSIVGVSVFISAERRYEGQ